MTVRKNQLLDQLEKLRDHLKEELIKEGVSKPICNDQALIEMAKKKPERLSDFLAISGLDKDFLEMYAHLFLEIILFHTKKDVKKVNVSKAASFVLDRYKDRLTNISKTNPNLYMGKIEKLRSFDLYDEQKLDELKAFLSRKKDTYKLDTANEADFLSLTTLYRHMNKDYKDYGTYHLYLGYPYVEGIFKKDNFPIKAPLAYMPVKLERIKKTYILSFDTHKDIVLNRDLVLAVSRIEKANIDEKMPLISDLSHKTIMDTVIPFYINQGLEVKKTQKFDYIPFKSELKDDFVKSHKANFDIKGYITFGRYQLYSSMIQKDMADIIEQRSYNDLLEGLIDETNLYDEQKPLLTQVSTDNINESKLVYINDINFSQEKVIEMIDQHKKMVIWGPPGTGKSQTITSLIANQSLRGENVLVVSEKKVALDVIYHRLGAASKFAMFIDDASDKTKFYEQLAHFMDQRPPVRRHNNDIYRLEEGIKELDDTFNKALELLYKKQYQYKPLAYFYERYVKDKDIIETLTPKKIHQLFKHYLGTIDFDDVERLEHTFDKDRKLKTYLEYHHFMSKYRWFGKLETKISRSSLIEFSHFMDELHVFEQSYRKAWYFRKRSLRFNFLMKNQMRLSFMSNKKSIDKKLVYALVKDHAFRKYLETAIKTLNKTKTIYDKLKPLDLKFLDMLNKDESIKTLDPIEKYRSYLFDGYFTGFLEDFKATHQKYLFILDSYDKKMTEFKEFIAEKRDVTKESFEMTLFTHALDFSNTKRIMDIKRILESDKKPSVKAFFDMFHVELFSHIKVWLLTPEAISTVIPLKLNLFDLVIFDEASQMYVEKGIPAIYRAKKVVIAGDPKQLRPSSLGFGRVDEEDPFEEDEILGHVTYDAKSLLDLARYKYKEALLNYHYRSQYQELIEFSNHAFYDGKLIISPNVSQPKTPPITYIYVKEATFYKRSNVEEAKEVIKLLKTVLKDKNEHESVGIITFNSIQRDLILNYIDDELFKKSIFQKRLEQEVYRSQDQEDQSLFVKNIENVQGDERDIIIFSMGYAKDDTGVVKRRFGWLNHEGGQNRLNVAITRAKKKIYFVSSLYPEHLKVDDLSGKGPKLLKDFMRYCYYVSNQNHELAKEVLMGLYQKESLTKTKLLSHMASEIKQRLIRLGYHVDEAIGIGQFKMDLAIYDEDKKAYLLGIICDISNEYHMTVRKELFHQEKFLNARGWEILRVFHMHWYENPNGVLNEIKDRLKSKN
ncbi:MAG: AAA domain-containing protein [Acholeplasmataceae bacterium]